MHRYHKLIEFGTILELHDALYLMQIAYLPSDERIKNEVNKFRNGTYEVVYTETTGQPTEPAHFIMIPKVEEATIQEEDRSSVSISNLVGSSRQESVLEIIIALRGSGDIGDFVSDSMLNATSYRSGVAHDGILKSGKFLAKLHIEKIRELWKVSGRDRVQVLLVGYSLGAGVAAIAAMELNEYDFIGKCMYTLYTSIRDTT